MSRSEVVASRENIFRWAAFAGGFHDPPAEAMVQGGFWMLERSQIRSVRTFRSR